MATSTPDQVSNDDARAALIWLLDTFEMLDQPVLGYVTTSCDTHKQTRTYGCYGCAGEFVSSYPEWVEPTKETFPHAADCRYVAMMRVVGRW